MLLSCFLLFFLCKSTVLQSTVRTTTYTTTISTATAAATERPFSLQLVATPEYPVAAGQSVHLHCIILNIPDSIRWSWQHLVNQTWKDVGNSSDLTLTEPEQSGDYRCKAESPLSQKVSSTHTVYIVAMHVTVTDNLGIAAFFLSLLALIINIAILFWLGWQRLNTTLTTSNTAAKAFPGPEKSPKGGLPQTESDGDVYINYTNTSPAYTDLDPTSMTEDNVYSSLS